MRGISFLGVQTDRQAGFWNPHMETCRHTKIFNSKLVVCCRSLYYMPNYRKGKKTVGVHTCIYVYTYHSQIQWQVY